jgi:hypothetical protein
MLIEIFDTDEKRTIIVRNGVEIADLENASFLEIMKVLKPHLSPKAIATLATVKGRPNGSTKDPTREQIEILENEISNGEFRKKRVAEIFGCHEETAREWLVRNPQYLEVLESNRKTNRSPEKRVEQNRANWAKRKAKPRHART